MQVRAKETQVGHGTDQFAGEAPFAITLLDNWNQIFFDEAACGIAHQPFIITHEGVQFYKVHSSEFEGGHRIISFKKIKTAFHISGLEQARTSRAP